MKKPTCNICKGVVLVEIGRAKVINHRTKKTYNRIRYACPLEPNDTTHMQTIYGDGSHDIEEEPIRAEKEVNNYYRQQERNQE